MKYFYNDIDLQNNQLIQAKFEKLANDPTPTTGRFYFNTVSNIFKYYNGTQWISIGASQNQFKGSYDASTPGQFPGNDTTTKAGDFWIVYIAGTQTGIIGSSVLTIGDLLYANVDNANQTAGNYFSIQSNINAATETAQGYIQLATDAEVITGTNANKAVTPASLANLLNTKSYEQDFGNGSSLTYTITHNLGTKDILVSISKNDQEVSMEFTKTDINTITITSIAPAPNNYRVIIRKK